MIRFVDHICDGFFPLELEKHHPNGVVFDAHDHSDKTYEAFKKLVKYLFSPHTEHSLKHIANAPSQPPLQL